MNDHEINKTGIDPHLAGYQGWAFHEGDLELYDHLPQLEPIARSIKDDLTPIYPNSDLVIPVMVAGLSLASKTTVFSQLWEEHSRDRNIQTWQKTHGVKHRYYFLDTGMVRELGTHLGMIKGEQGKLTLSDYQGLSDLTEELVPLGIQYLKGPGQLGLEFVWTTAFLNPSGETIGTPRGSLRLAQRLIANNNGRLIVLTTSEELKDRMGEAREQARLAKPEEIQNIVSSAGNIHSVLDPKLIHAYYMLSSNKDTRIQQANDVAICIWEALPDQREKFADFEDFKRYYFGENRQTLSAVMTDRRSEWEQLSLKYHEKWLEGIFHKPLAQIDASQGVVIENPLLEKESEEETDENQPVMLVPRHVYDQRLSAAGFFKALIKRSMEIDAGSLKAAVRRFELEELKIYSLT